MRGPDDIDGGDGYNEGMAGLRDDEPSAKHRGAASARRTEEKADDDCSGVNEAMGGLAEDD